MFCYDKNKENVLCKKENLKELEQFIAIFNKNQDNLGVMLDMVADIQKILYIWRDVTGCKELIEELALKINHHLKQLQ